MCYNQFTDEQVDMLIRLNVADKVETTMLTLLSTVSALDNVDDILAHVKTQTRLAQYDFRDAQTNFEVCGGSDVLMKIFKETNE
jgi:hypothetical protein